MGEHQGWHHRSPSRHAAVSVAAATQRLVWMMPAQYYVDLKWVFAVGAPHDIRPPCAELGRVAHRGQETVQAHAAGRAVVIYNIAAMTFISMQIEIQEAHDAQGLGRSVGSRPRACNPGWLMAHAPWLQMSMQIAAHLWKWKLRCVAVLHTHTAAGLAITLVRNPRRRRLRGTSTPERKAQSAPMPPAQGKRS